ncbi:MAG: ferritin [Elusimicrobia bacterium]|nr:ferritin [Candidatus Liberimonas magnetica]
MIKERLQETISRQINRELYSGYLYLSMAQYFNSINLKGFSNWMKVQVGEEKSHAMKFYNYVYKRGGIVILGKIEAPPTKWKSPLDAFMHTLEHEQKVTKLIHDLVRLAKSEDDKEAVDFLDWYVKEQQEEEESAAKVIAKIKKAKDLALLDKEMARRVFKPPKYDARGIIL